MVKSDQCLQLFSSRCFFAILPMVFLQAHQSIAIGESILEKMVGEKVSDFSFKRKDQATTMHAKNGVKVDGEIVQFEPYILHQKLAVAAERFDNIDPETIFEHKLTTIPKALAATPELLH